MKDDITPTRIADVEGAPPTLAPNATPFSSSGDEGGGEAAAPASGPITVTGLDSLAFDPASFTAAPGQTIHFVNGGALQHDFIVDELGITMDPINGGEEVDLTVPEDAELGDYTYYCSVPGHREAGMEGTLTVAEGGGEEAAAEEGGDEAAAGGGGGPITVTGHDSLSFDPDAFEASPGQTIHFVNGGALQHDFIVDELGITMDPVDGGGEVDVTVPEDAELGEYTYYCSIPGHREAGMEGTLTVVEASAGGGDEEAATEEATEEATPEEEEAAAAGGGAPAGPIEVQTLDALAFEPSEFEASPGQEILVVNVGSLQHDFVIDELEMATDLLNNSEEQTITVPEDAEVGQSFTFYCTVPGHQQAGMEGTMTIVEAGGGGEAAAEETEGESEEAAAAPVDPVDPSQPVEVTTLDTMAFDPSEIVVAPGQTILVTNAGELEHDFVVDEWGLATALLRQGETGELVVPGDARVGETYTYYCSVAGHAAAGMQGRLTVAEAIGGEAAEEGSPAAEATEEGVQVESGAEVEPDAIRVASLDSMRFAPSQFSAAPGQQIHLVNPGVLIHDIVVDEWGLDSGALGGGEETTFRIPDDVEIGAEVEFYCSVPGHRESGMVGTITIIEADVTQEEAVTPAAEASPVAEATPAEETAAAAGAEEAAATPAAAASPAADGGAAASGDTIEVILVDMAFEPAELTIPADTDVDIHLVNEGFLEHDFHVEDTDFASDILPGAQQAEETITINLPAGEYVYFCSVPGHRESGMEGTLTVE